MLFVNDFNYAHHNCSKIITEFQNLFAKMLLFKKPPSIEKVLKSLKFDVQYFNQDQDAMEFFTLLYQKMEKYFRGSELLDILKDLFLGEMESILIYQKNSCEETVYTYNAISLKIINKDDLLTCIRDQINEISFISNYRTKRNEFCDAQLHYKYLIFPNILIIHLQRFIYNIETNKTQKINSKFEFLEHLSLNDMIEQHADQNSSNEFTLFGIVTHSGNALHGHYCTYIRPNCGEDWFFLNDSIVYKVTNLNEIFTTFGSNDDINQYSRDLVAYILFYVRDEKKSEIFHECPLEIIPQRILQPLIQEVNQRPKCYFMPTKMNSYIFDKLLTLSQNTLTQKNFHKISNQQFMIIQPQDDRMGKN
jgi:hypothetical protein